MKSLLILSVGRADFSFSFSFLSCAIAFELNSILFEVLKHRIIPRVCFGVAVRRGQVAELHSGRR